MSFVFQTTFIHMHWSQSELYRHWAFHLFTLQEPKREQELVSDTDHFKTEASASEYFGIC